MQCVYLHLRLNCLRHQRAHKHVCTHIYVRAVIISSGAAITSSLYTSDSIARAISMSSLADRIASVKDELTVLVKQHELDTFPEGAEALPK